MRQHESPAKTATNGHGIKDPASSENRSYPVHRWVPWIAGFSAGFVDDVLTRYLQRNGSHSPLVLDPFCGVGTTLVQCQRRGVHSIGFEINPYAAMASRVKTNALHLNKYVLESIASQYRQWMAIDKSTTSGNSHAPEGLQAQRHPPDGFKSRIPFYSEKVLRQVLKTLDFINTIIDPAIKEVFLIALGSVMVKFSNYSYEPSLATRPGSGKPLVDDAPVSDILGAKLDEMLTDISAVQEESHEVLPRTRIWEDSFEQADRYIADESIDLAITSPPYLNNYHYVRNTRPQLWWLGLVRDAKDLKTLERRSMGKFWQTVRAGGTVALDVASPNLHTIVNSIRKQNEEKGPYGGPGWANYVSAYFNDLATFMSTLSRVLRPKARAIVVIGNSIIQGIEVKVDSFMAEIGEIYGLRLDANEVIRAKRVGSSIVNSSVRRSSERLTVMLYDAAVVLSKR